MDLVSIDRNAMPANEHEAATSVEQNLTALQTNAKEFRETAQTHKRARKPPCSLAIFDVHSISDSKPGIGDFRSVRRADQETRRTLSRRQLPTFP